MSHLSVVRLIYAIFILKRISTHEKARSIAHERTGMAMPRRKPARKLHEKRLLKGRTQGGKAGDEPKLSNSGCRPRKISLPAKTQEEITNTVESMKRRAEKSGK